MSLPLPQPTPLFIFIAETLRTLLTFANAYITMYKLTWILVAFFTLTLSALAAPVPEEFQGLEKRTTHSGRVRVLISFNRSWCRPSHLQGTWYYTGLGNCGWTNSNSQLVVAMPQSLYDENNGSNCGQVWWSHYIRINHT